MIPQPITTSPNYPQVFFFKKFIKDKKVKFAQSSRRGEYLDVFNVKLNEERSPGPAIYNS